MNFLKKMKKTVSETRFLLVADAYGPKGLFVAPNLEWRKTLEIGEKKGADNASPSKIGRAD